MKIINDVKRDLRFLIESKLTKQLAIQTISELYKNERLNPESIGLWYDQVRREIPSYVQRTTTNEPQVCDIKKSIVGGKTIKGSIITHDRKKSSRKDNTPYYKRGGERRWHNIVVGGTMISARRNLKAAKASISATYRFMELIDSDEPNPEKAIIDIVDKEYREGYTLDNKNDILTRFASDYIDNKAVFLMMPKIGKEIAEGRDIERVARKYKITKDVIIDMVKKHSFVFFTFYDMGALTFIEGMEEYGKTTYHSK